MLSGYDGWKLGYPEAWDIIDALADMQPEEEAWEEVSPTAADLALAGFITWDEAEVVMGAEALDELIWDGSRTWLKAA